MRTYLSRRIANYFNSTVTFLFAYLFLSTKLWCKLYFNIVIYISMDFSDRVKTGIL